MDATTRTRQQDNEPVYTTSKQVQAWFLGRSRDLWKKKYAELKVELQATHNSTSRTSAVVERTGEAKRKTARERQQELRAQNAELQARLDVLSEEAAKKK